MSEPGKDNEKNINEYRAALLSVALATDPRGDISPILAPALRPVSLPKATRLILDLPDEQQQTQAKVQAATRLASAAFIDRTPEAGRFKPQLAELVGGTAKADELQEKLEDDKRRIDSRIEETLKEDAANGNNQELRIDRELKLGPKAAARIPMIQKELLLRNSLQKEFLLQHVQEELKSPSIAQRRNIRTDATLRPPPKMASIVKRSRKPQSLEPAAPKVKKEKKKGRPTSQLDLKTLTTQVDITSESNQSFEDLARVLDPRKWNASPFWRASTPLKLDEETLTFTERTDIVDATVLSEGWQGHLLEHVEWNWNLTTVSSFRNILAIDYRVDPKAHTISLGFSLHACEGSEFFALVQRRGIDIDWGFQFVDLLNNDPANPRWMLQTQKNVRFSDILNRRTPFEGTVGSGQILSYLAPAIVGLWMNDLLEHLDKNLAANKGGRGNGVNR